MLRQALAAAVPIMLLLFAGACGGSAPTPSSGSSSPVTSPTPSEITAQQAMNDLLQYSGCPNATREDLSNAIKNASQAPGLQVQDAQVVQRNGDVLNVAVNYELGGQRRQALFSVDTKAKTVSGQDPVARAAIQAMKAACH